MIVDIRGDAQAARSSDLPMADTAPDMLYDPAIDLNDYEQVESPDRLAWLPAAGAGLATLAWVGGMVWLARDQLGTLSPVDLAQFLAALAVVPALIGIVWLLLRRSSRAEAKRFGETAAAMRAEAASLERTVAVIGRTLDANRARLSEQTTQLMAIGDSANERLAGIGHGMVTEIAQADDHSRRLAEASAAARATLDTLVATMMRAHGDTERVSELLDATGRSASTSAAALETQLASLVERGREADTTAGGAAGRLAAHILRMDETGDIASRRLEAIVADMSDTIDALMGRTSDSVDDARKGLTAHGDTMLAMVGQHQASLDLAARESAEALGRRIESVEAMIERVTGRLEAERAAGDFIVQSLDDGIAGVERRLETLHVQGVERSQMLAASISALGGSADAMTEALRAGDSMATRTIGTTESLLIALDAAAREIDETLPDALARLDQRIVASKGIVVAAKPELLALVMAAESTHDAIEAIAGVISEQRRTLDTLSTTLLDTLNTGRTKADALGQMVNETIDRTHRFSEEAAPRLIDALLRVRDTATAAADRARETLATVIPEAADALEAATADAMRRAASVSVERQVQSLEHATDAAVSATTRAGERLSHQVQAILEQTAIVETRIEDARAEREEADSDTFARRVSLLIESLNSASIDITKAFAPEVSDSAWAAYLKGDRGVFTRRAVRVLDTNEARDVANLYDEDASFREMVNRYIHDFESMLRAILAQRDGSPLGVTLLSSDMGKLYVSLAQAIERLR